MITAVDTNILLDVLLPDSSHGPQSAALLQKASEQGSLIICEIVYAELAAFFPEQRLLQTTLHKFGVHLRASNEVTLFRSGQHWKAYRQRKKKSTEQSSSRVLADFLIGAHAQVQADRLLTRDRGFYKTYFDPLRILSD
jgi:predicted nucleic acid-binding protein